MAEGVNKHILHLVNIRELTFPYHVALRGSYDPQECKVLSPVDVVGQCVGVGEEWRRWEGMEGLKSGERCWCRGGTVEN